MVKMKHYLSFGGGVNSVALYILMQSLGVDFEAVFVDHKTDYPETYQYLEYFKNTGRPVTVIKPCVARKKEGKTYNDLYEYCLSRKIVPSVKHRWCTSHFKVEPLQRYMQTPCFVHLGIDAGEARRARLSSVDGMENRYPLIEHDIDRAGCKKMIRNAGLRVPPKSGCFICPFQRKSAWIRLRRDHPELFCKALQLEEALIASLSEKGKKPFTIRSDRIRLKDLLDQRQANLFDELDYPPCQCEL